MGNLHYFLQHLTILTAFTNFYCGEIIILRSLGKFTVGNKLVGIK